MSKPALVIAKSIALSIAVLLATANSEARTLSSSSDIDTDNINIITLEDGTEVAAGSLIVNYKKGSPQAPKAGKKPDLPEQAAASQIKKTRAFSEIDVSAIELVDDNGKPLKSPEELKAAKKDLSKEPGVESVSYDPIATSAWNPNDIRFRDGSQPNLKAIRAPFAWDKSRGRVRIGIVDSGCFMRHADLNASNKIIAQRDFVNDDPWAEDLFGHGTHVTSIAASETNNTTGVAATAPAARIICAKATNSHGLGTLSNLLDAVRFARNNNAKVINMSWILKNDHTSMRRLMGNLENNNITAVAASGNSSTKRAYYPATYKSVIGVGAMNRYGTKLAGYSTRGPGTNIVAPGSDILAACIGKVYRYCQKSGTSQAAPHVAGSAALLRASGRGVERTRRALYRSATDFGPVGYDSAFGHGRLNANRAFKY